MAQATYDLIVVGSGPGGQKAAITGAKLRKRVAIVERKPYLGGVSLQTGTIPSKALREAAFLASRFAAKGMRGSFHRYHELGTDFLGEAIHKKNTVVDNKEAALLSQLLRHGVSIVPGEAAFHDDHTLAVTTPSGQVEKISADVIVLAAGSRPRRPPEIPFDKERVLDSTSIMNMRRLPASLIVVGGGVIACEFATMFAPLGVNVSIVDSHERILAYLDEDIANNLMEHMRDLGIELHMNSRVASVEREAHQVRLTTEGGDIHGADCLLYAMGRQPNYENLHIENAGLTADDHGWVRINQYFQSPVPHIYVVGDLAGAPALASTAMEEGRIAVYHAFGQAWPAQSAPLPMAIYTIPELSYVGETERQLQQRGADYVVGKAHYAETARGQIIGDYRGMLKLLVERHNRKLLGVHIIGESASELIHVGQMVFGCGGSVDSIANTVFNYPTLAQCYKSAADDCLDHLGPA